MALSRGQLETLERLLVKDRDRALRHLRRFDESLADEASEHAFSLHIADQGTNMMEKEKAFLLAGEEGRRLLDIDAALRRLYGDPTSFGTCTSCGRDIDFQRLQAVPHTVLCVTCKKAEEERDL